MYAIVHDRLIEFTVVSQYPYSIVIVMAYTINIKGMMDLNAICLSWTISANSSTSVVTAKTFSSSMNVSIDLTPTNCTILPPAKPYNTVKSKTTDHNTYNEYYVSVEAYNVYLSTYWQ